MDCQLISIYGTFVTSQTATFSRSDINYSNGSVPCTRNCGGQCPTYYTIIPTFNLVNQGLNSTLHDLVLSQFNFSYSYL